LGNRCVRNRLHDTKKVAGAVLELADEQLPGPLQTLVGGDVPKGDDNAVNDILDGAVGADAHEKTCSAVLEVELALDNTERALSDGALGVRKIKEQGGLTLAQAEFDHVAQGGMPQSAADTGMVDHIVPVEDMPRLLVDYQQHLGAVEKRKDGNGTRTDVRPHLAAISGLLRAGIDHDFSGYKEHTLIRRIQRRMQVLHIDDVPSYVERLKADRGELEALFHDLLISVTQFFRDPNAFEALKRIALAPLASAKAADQPIRIWVPGCATGEEVYSIAILLSECMAEGHRGNDIKIFGTDIDENAIAIARGGLYRQPLTGVSPERLERWFIKDGEHYRVRREIRELCTFSVHSIVKDPPFSRLDLISCRNVLIYLDTELQDRVMQTFHYALEAGRLFVSGHVGKHHAQCQIFRDRRREAAHLWATRHRGAVVAALKTVLCSLTTYARASADPR
jgi:two-component system, chemotaxis family, CheB/CheR fusion protein